MLQKDESAWTAEPRRLHCGGETAPDTTCVMRVASTIKWTGKTGHWLSPRDVWWVISPPLFAFGARYIIIHTRVCPSAPAVFVYNEIILLFYRILYGYIYIYTHIRNIFYNDPEISRWNLNAKDWTRKKNSKKKNPKK